MRIHAVTAVAAAAAISAVQAVAAGSPPGHAGKIVFVGDSHVLVANADGTGLRDLSRPREDAGGGIAVSPDGRRIVVDFIGCCLVLMSGNGSGRVQISNEANSPAWAPDGKHVAYVDQSDAGDVHVVSATGSNRRTLRVGANGYSGAGLAWSPDGSRLAFITDSGVGVVDAARGAVTTPGGMSAATSVVGWSPDGRKIAFLTKKRALYVASVDGGAPTLVGRGQNDYSTPAWSPDGKRFLMTTGDPTQIHVVGVDGTHDRRLTQSEWGEASSSPAWSPDGKQIAFLRGRLPGTYGDSDLWTMKADGTGKRMRTTALELRGASADGLLSPAWVPGRAAGGVPIRALRTIPVRASRVANVPVVDSDISADAGGLAVAAGCKVRSWEDGHVRVHGPESGVGRWPCAGFAALASAGGRTAWIGSHGHGDDSWSALFVAGPNGRRLVESAFSYCCPGDESGGKYLEGITGDGPLLVYDTWTSEKPTRVKLWRLDGTRKVLIRSGADAGPVVAVDSGRIATLQADGTLTMLSGSGAKLTALKLGKSVDGVRLDGSHVILLRYGRAEVYDMASGRRTQIRRLALPLHDKATLEDAQDGLVVYTLRIDTGFAFRAGLDVHVLRLSDGRDVVLGLRDEASAAHAQLVRGGLYYAYNQAWRRTPGRLGFVSMQEIDRILARRG